MIQVAEEKERYLSDFDELEKNIGLHQPAWLRSLRREAIDRFLEMDFPTIRDEEWRFTNLAPLLKIPFKHLAEAAVGLTASDLEPFAFSDMPWNRLVFVNGLFSKALSNIRPSAPVKIQSLRQSLETAPEALKPHLVRPAGINENIFSVLNTAFIDDGAVLTIPNGKVVEDPIHILFVSTAPNRETVSFPRTLILMGRGSMAAFVESYIGLENHTYLTNSVTQLMVGEGAVVDYYKLQSESQKSFHLATTQVHQERSSVFSSFAHDRGAKLARNNLNVLLDGEGAECTLNGLYCVTDDQVVDNHTTIDHAKPHGTSHELYKGILNGHSKAIFNGKIIVRMDAQKTDAKQTNKNLVLSDDAQVSTNPQLEILADDVKCTHGATVGQLDEDAIFYLNSRGMDRKKARGLLTYGFATSMINQIKVPRIQAQLSALIANKLQGHPWSREAI